MFNMALTERFYAFLSRLSRHYLPPFFTPKAHFFRDTSCTVCYTPFSSTPSHTFRDASCTVYCTPFCPTAARPFGDVSFTVLHFILFLNSSLLLSNTSTHRYDSMQHLDMYLTFSMLECVYQWSVCSQSQVTMQLLKTNSFQATSTFSLHCQCLVSCPDPFQKNQEKGLAIQRLVILQDIL